MLGDGEVALGGVVGEVEGGFEDWCRYLPE